MTVTRNRILTLTALHSMGNRGNPVQALFLKGEGA